MADVQSNIQVNIDTTAALANLKNLQRQLATFNASFAKSSTTAVKAQAEFSNNLINSINATGKFAAGIQEIQSSTERFTQSLEKNKFSTREYFKYAAGSTKAFSKMFSSEFNTIQKVAEERVKDLQTQYIKMGRGANGALKAIAVRPLSLDMDDLATKVAITSQKQQIFGQLLKQGSTNLLNFGKNTQWAGRQLMVGFTIPLTIFGTKAAQVFMDLELQAIRFKRVYGEMFTTQGETTKALNEIRKLAEEFTKYGVAVVDTMKMAADAAAQGKQGADLMAQVAEATRLAVLGQVEQQQALETTMSLQNAFGYSAEQLAGKINFLNAVENQTVVGIEDLTIAIPKAGPVVKQLGGDVEDLAFFLTAMKEGGINASEGANALKSGLASLINPSEKASAMLKEMGVDIQGIVQSNKGDIKGTVIGFAQALDTLAPLERARAIEQLFGKFQFARLSTLFQNVTKDGNQAARTLELTTKSVEELAIMSERELGAVEDATGTKFKKSMEDLKVAIAPVGEQFLKAVTPIAEFVGKVLEKFNGLSDGVKGGISKLVLIVGAIGPVVLMTFGLLANGLANIIKLFGAVRNGFLGLGKNSQFLGNQTNYLTTEQQEAATIAASLDQAHSKLIQTFTLERNSIALLAEAYGQAALAATRLKMSNPGYFSAGGPKPKGYAEGVVSVPGPKGAGDVVPAMLSPGEAIIPADQNKKYAPLIQGIIADNIPGFAGGSSGVASHLEGLTPAQLPATLADPVLQKVLSLMPDVKVGLRVLSTTTDGLVTIAKPLIISLKDLATELSQNNIESLTAVGTDRFSGTTTPGSSERNSMLNAAGIAGEPKTYEELVAASAKAKEYVSSGKDIDKRKEAAALVSEQVNIEKQMLGLTDKQRIQAEIDYSRDKHAAAIEDALIKSRVSAGKASVMARDQILEAEKAVQPLLLQAKSEKEKQVILEKAHTAALLKHSTMFAGYDESKTSTEVFNKTQLKMVLRDIPRSQLQYGTPYGDDEIVPEDAAKFNGRAFKGLSGRRLSRNQSAIVDANINAEYKQDKAETYKILKASYTVGSQAARGAIDGFKDTAEIKSPSRIMYIAGAELAKGAIKGFKDAAAKLTRSGAAGELVPTEKTKQPKYKRDGLKIVPVGTTAPNVVDEKDGQLRDAERQKRKIMLARTNGVLFGMSSLSSVLGMMGNGIAQKAAPFMVAMNVATMAMQVIQGPWSALAVGAIALVAGFYYLLEKNKQQAKAQSQYIETMSATTEKMKSIGKLTGNIGASELMDKRRSMGTLDKYLTGFDRKGQQFGTSMMESDIGKQIYENFTVALSSDRGGAVKQFGLQLGSYVADGVMSLEQAESFARSIGISLNDMTVSSQIVGELRELLGPNGENLLETPLLLRTRIIEENLDIGKNSLKGFEESISKLGIAGKTWSGLKSIFTETEVERYAAQVAAVNVQNIEAVQAQVDAQNNLYSKKIQELKKQKELTKDKEKQAALDEQISALTTKQKTETSQLRKGIGKVLDEQMKAYELANVNNVKLGTEVPFFESLKEQVRQKYKDTNAAGAEAFLAKSSNLVSAFSTNETRVKAQRLEVIIDTLVGGGALEVGAATNLLEMFGSDKEKMLKTVSTAFEINDAGQVSEVSNVLYTLFGEKNPEIGAKIFTEITSKKGSGKFEDRAATLAALFKLQGKELKASMIIDDNGSLEKLDQIIELSNKIENLPDPIEKNAIMNILTEGLDIQAGEQKELMAFWDYISKLPKEQQKTAIQSFIQIYKTITPEEEKAAEDAAIAKAGGSILPESVQQKIRGDVGKVATTVGQVKPIYGKTGILPKPSGSTPPPKKKGDGRDTTFDDMNKKLKLFQQASVNSLKGFKELKRVMDLGGKKGGAYMTFNGITNQLVATKKLSTEFIDMIEGLSPEEIQKKFGKFGLEIEKGVVKFKNGIKAGAEQINKALASIAAGEIVANNAKEMQKLENRTAAVNKLRKQGIDYATAMAITESDSIALEIRNGRLKGKALEELVESQQKRNDLEEYYNKVVLTKQQDAIVSQQTANEQMLEFLELQNAIAENQFIVQKTEIEIAAKRNGYALELINYEEELANKVYDKQIQALDEIVKRNEEINRLQEGRFSIAEALARGDMAAAARAIQSVRQQEIQAQLEAKRKSIEEARKKTLESITADGKTRKQIEEENAKSAADLAKINLDIVKKQIAYAQEFTKALKRTPEELKAYNDIATKIQEIGGFKLDSQSLLSAIKDAVAGKPQALLSSVAGVINERIKDLFGAKVAGVAMNYDENGNPIVKPSGNETDLTPIGINTTATTDNTAALKTLTEKITVGSISAKSEQSDSTSESGAIADDWMFNRGLGFNFTPVSSSSKPSKKKTSKKKASNSSKITDGKKPTTKKPTTKKPTTKKPETVRQGEKKVVTTPTGINVRNGDTTKPTTVSGSGIDINVRPSSDVVRETVAWVERQEQLAEEQRQRNIDQLTASKNAERSSANASDAVGRMSPLVAEMMGIYSSTMQFLGNNARAEAKKEDVADVQRILNEKAASNAREEQIKDKAALTVPEAIEQAKRNAIAEPKAIEARDNAIADKKSLTVPQAIAAANDAGRLADRVASTAIIAKKVADANNESRINDKKLSNTMFEIYTGVAAQQATLNRDAQAADKKFSSISIASQINKPSIRAIEGAGVSNPTLNRDAQAADKKAESAKATAKANITSPLNLAASRATGAWTAMYRSTGGMVPKYMNMGGIVPKYFAAGGYGKGTDTIPAMLTPGEFVIQKRAVDMLGTGVMNNINNGELPGNSVYNYSLSVNVSNSNANPNDIARTVINQIKQIDSQRIRGNR